MAKVKNKKSKLADVYAKKRKRQQSKKTMTPFEVHVNRDKRKVLGQKSKADRGLPGVARTKAIVKRKGTLLQEYKVKDKDNILLDKRLHQRNPNMSEEDKALARFAKERIKAHNKKNIFNLNDDEILTHRGQAIIDIEKFDNPNSDEDGGFSDDENRTGKLDKKFLEEAHFGGGLLSKPDSETSRKSVIEQLIADSKKRKSERQKVREQTQDLTEKLDSEWKDLLPILTTSNKSLEKPVEKEKADDYDITVRQLKFEPRSATSDKLIPEEELAEKEQIRLEKLEKERVERMKGFSEEDNFYKKHKSADDLDVGFKEEIIEDISDQENPESKDNTDDSEIETDLDENEEEVEGKDDEGEEEEEQEEEEVDEEDEEKGEKHRKEKEDKNENVKEDNQECLNQKSDSKRISEESEDEDDEDNLSDLKVSDSSSEDEEPPERPPSSKAESKNFTQNLKNVSRTEDVKKKDSPCEANDKISEKARAELPETFIVPEVYEDLKKLLQNHNELYQSIILERLIKCNHWSLGKVNREKLAGLFEHLLMYMDCSDLSSAENVVKSFKILDRLCPHLYDLAHANPENAKKCFQGIIKAKHDEFEENKKKYVGINLLIFLKLASLIFPTSDFRHPVVSPCLVFMSQILLRCSIRKKCHVSRGLFISTLILEYTTLSKRFAPSAINFLRGLLYLSMPKPSKDVSIKIIPPFKKEGVFSSLLAIDEKINDLEIDLDRVQMKASDLIEDEIDSDFKIRVFVTTLNLISEFKKLYEELESVYAIFEPILKILKCDFIKHYPKNLKRKVKVLIEELEVLKSIKLEHITREKKKPKVLRLYEPRIERVYEGRRHKPMSEAKAQKEKMLHKIKREMKGAIREVRRDTAFLAKLKIKEQIKSDQERKRKVKEIFGDAAVQQSEFNKMKRQK